MHWNHFINAQKKISESKLNCSVRMQMSMYIQGKVSIDPYQVYFILENSIANKSSLSAEFFFNGKLPEFRFPDHLFCNLIFPAEKIVATDWKLFQRNQWIFWKIYTPRWRKQISAKYLLTGRSTLPFLTTKKNCSPNLFFPCKRQRFYF